MGSTGIGPEAFMNLYFEVPTSLVYALVGTLLAFVALFMAAAYYALNRRFLSDLPDEKPSPF
jgi:cytochrome d ubiquinol oxidase subunit I